MSILTDLNIMEINISTANLSTKISVAYQLNVGGNWTAKKAYVKGLNGLTGEALTDIINNEPKLLHYRDAFKIFGNLDSTKYVMDLHEFNS